MSQYAESAVRIRDASATDRESVLALMREYWAFEQVAGFDPVRVGRQLDVFLSSPRWGRLWVAESQGRLVGYLVGAYVYSFEYGGPMAEFDELFVIETCRGRGIGQQLLDTGREALKGDGCVAVQLMVADWNETGQRFYQQRRFAPKVGYRLWVAPLAATRQS